MRLDAKQRSDGDLLAWAKHLGTVDDDECPEMMGLGYDRDVDGPPRHYVPYCLAGRNTWTSALVALGVAGPMTPEHPWYEPWTELRGWMEEQGYGRGKWPQRSEAFAAALDRKLEQLHTKYGEIK
jgi:hypothetical protein